MRAALALVLAFGTAAAVAPPAVAAAPPGFSDSVVVSLPGPTSVDWTPDGRMLVTQDAGQLRVVRNDVLRKTPALDLASRLCSPGERGLTGLVVDPDFATNKWIYLFWTFNKFGSCAEDGSATTPVNRVARYTLGDDDLVVPGSERVIVDNLPSPASNHNGGDLKIGADKLLYVTVGDGGCQLGSPSQCAALNSNSRRLDIPNGKVLRVTRTGQVPRGNPFVGQAGARRCTAPSGVSPGTGPCSETWASGLRNPFRMAQRPGTSTFYVNDVGQDTWEEVNLLQKGADYGWNVREGFCATGSTTDCGPSPYTDPIFAYGHDKGCGAITGGAFVPRALWPELPGGSYLYADFVCGSVFRMAPKAGGGFTPQPFLTGLDSPVQVEFGPYGSSQALYYVSYFGGAVRRVSRPDTNVPPTASFTARPDGQTVAFDGRASADPDGGDRVVSWRWDFGDGTTATTSTPTTRHTYPAARTYTATLRVVDTAGAVSRPVRRQVQAGQHAPQLNVTDPPQDARFAVGQNVVVRASATDQDQGELPGDAITWTVRKRHNTHSHPFLGPVTGSSINLVFPAPENLAATTTSYLEVTAVARDSTGLTTTAVRRLQPRTVALTLAATPAGAELEVAGVRRAAPFTVTSWAGWTVRVQAPSPQQVGGTRYAFQAWSDGGYRVHDVVTPQVATTYRARYVPQ